MMKKIFINILLLASFSAAYGFDEGFIWALKANFNGTATLPSISKDDLDKIGAAYMKGSVGYTMDGEAELGYLFGSERWFNGMSPDKFSGMSVFVSLGVGNGFAGQVAGNEIEGVKAAAYINVSYAPVISFGVGTKAYFLNSRLALGLHIGGKLIADLSPEYLAYFDQEMPGFPEIGEIIVTDEPLVKTTTQKVKRHEQDKHPEQMDLPIALPLPAHPDTRLGRERGGIQETFQKLHASCGQ